MTTCSNYLILSGVLIDQMIPFDRRRPASVGWGKAETGFPLASRSKFLESIAVMILD
jgi:hypothetical protein